MNLFKRICRPWIWCFSAFPQDRGYTIIRPDPNSDSFPMNPVNLLSMIAIDNRNQSRLHPHAITLYEIVFHGNKLQEYHARGSRRIDQIPSHRMMVHGLRPSSGARTSTLRNCGSENAQSPS